MSIDVVGRKRLLDPGGIDLAQALGAPAGLVDGKTLVAVRHDLVAVADSLAHGRKPGEVLGPVLLADLDLGAGEAFRLGGHRILDKRGRLDVQPAAFGGVERTTVLGATGEL